MATTSPTAARTATARAATDAMRLESPAFGDGDEIPARFSCGGDDVSPPLRWTGVPAETASLALLLEDLDAAVRPATLWTGWGIDPGAPGLDEGERAPVEGR